MKFPTMKLAELRPQFIALQDPRHWRHVESIIAADGIVFLCPKCFAANGREAHGTHSVVCWTPGVPHELQPGPGRWAFEGTGYGDLSLVAGSSSVALTGGCEAHFFVRAGEVIDA